jgi:nucleoside-diphosphate-sugar epimerase
MILVTGATGFVGQALCRDLLARGRSVAATYRGERRGQIPAGIEARQAGDLEADDPWCDSLSGIDAIVHLAGLAHVTEIRPDAAERAERVNAHATRSLGIAAARAGVRRLVYLSTAKVHGEASSAPFRETDAPAPSDPYAASKWAAEQALTEVAREQSLETVVLRPPLVYGPGVKANFLSLLALCDSPWPLPLGGLAANRRSFVFLGNLIAAIHRVLDHPRAAGRAFLVADGGALSTAELVRQIRRALGRLARLAAVPPAALQTLAASIGRQSAFERLTESFEIDASLIGRELDWRPAFSFEQGLAATAAWYRAGRS